jgi:hypothetical protein
MARVDESRHLSKYRSMETDEVGLNIWSKIGKSIGSM